jgi:predicted ArsR family transcriptional regulator
MNGKHRRGHARDPHFFETTRGRILVLLCQRRLTVAELAAELRVTPNAVRAQLERLERDGLARQVGSRRGVRKPHAEYEFTEEARELFPRAYEPALCSLVEILGERLPRKVTRDLFLHTGTRLLTEHVRVLRGRTPRRRLAEMIGRLNGSALGIDVVERSDGMVVRSCSCPLASVTATHPEVCEMFATLLGNALGTTVRERCERGGSPRCCFEIVDRRSASTSGRPS